MNKESVKKIPLIAGMLLGCQLAQADTLPCVIEPTESVEVGTEVIGVLKSVLVERGDTVKKGQILARLSANVERQTVDLASLRVKDFTEIESANAAREHAYREKDRAEQLFEQNLISKQALDKAATEASLAEHRLKQAREGHNQSKQELNLANAKLSQRYIKSPIDGIVSERYMSAGQRVQNEALVKIVKVSPLRVDVIIPAEHFKQFKLGEKYMITPELPGFEPTAATVTIIDRVIDAASNTFRITLNLPNHDSSIPAGARCQADLGIKNSYQSAADL